MTRVHTRKNTVVFFNGSVAFIKHHQSTMLSCTMVFYLLVVRALSGPWFQWSRTKRRRKCLNIFSLLCGAACCLFGCTAFVSTILGLGFMFMLNRFENKTRKRSWKIRMHRRMKPWKLRWYASRGSFPLRNLRPYSLLTETACS